MNERLQRTKDLITDFFRWAAAGGAGPLRIVGWPDEHKRNEPACDCIVSGPNGQVAIEHTSIDGFSRGREDDARYVKYFVPLADKLRPYAKAPTWIGFPIRALERGQNWNTIIEAIELDLKARLPILLQGTHKFIVPGTPFETRVIVRLSGEPNIMMSRLVDNESHEGKEELRTAIDKKNNQLSEYARSGLETWLLIELENIAFAEPTIYQEYMNQLKASGLNRSNIKRIFFADTSLSACDFRELR